MAKRKEFSAKTKAEAFILAQGSCEKCGVRLKSAEYDHIIPCELGGDNSLRNCQVLCVPCHRGEGGKTAQDQKKISKAKRVEAKNVGAIKPKGDIKSKGFDKKPKSKSEIPELPRRSLYRKG